MTTLSGDATPGQAAPAEKEALQFDRVITESTAARADARAVVCAACRASIETEYFDVNGNRVCGRCRALAESPADTRNIFIRMRQAWKMTGAPRLMILGPYCVGAVSAPASA